MNEEVLDRSLEKILSQYEQSFKTKTFNDESQEMDELMLVFGLTQEMKIENRQYWGRELGMCWQLLITEIFKQRCSNFGNPIREGADEICDLVVGLDAIDTKYRIGSGDSGTLKKFKAYGSKLRSMGLRPVLLILRNDNLPAAITACNTGGWVVIIGDYAYKYIFDKTKFDLHTWLHERKDRYKIKSKSKKSLLEFGL